MIRMNKKGSELDLIYILIFLFVASIVILMIYRFYIPIQEKIDSSVTGLDNPEKIRQISNSTSRTFASLDFLYVFLLGGIFMALIASSFYLDTNPVVFFVFFAILMVVMIAAPVISNTYNSFSTNSQFENASATFPIIDNVSNNFPIWIFFMAVIMGIMLYAKFRFFGG